MTKRPQLSTAAAKPYGIGRHQHLYAAWAASRAASVKGCRFRVEQGRSILEACGFTDNFYNPKLLPSASDTDATHRKWRAAVIKAARAQGLDFTHGVAAKLINCYLKSRFVCGGHHEDARVSSLHPPIDAVILKALAELGGKDAGQWRGLSAVRWSKFSSEDYEHAIRLIQGSLKGAPMWMIEEHWKGNQ